MAFKHAYNLVATLAWQNYIHRGGHHCSRTVAPNDFQVLFPETCGCVTLRGKRVFVGVIIVKDLEIVEIIWVYLFGLNVIRGSL